MEIVERDRSLALGAGKQKALLAILLLNANEVVSTDRLHDELWGESPPATAAKSIQLYVSRLRKELGEGRLVTRPPGYVLQGRAATSSTRHASGASSAKPATSSLSAPRASSARRSTSGAARRSPISSTSRSRKPEIARLREARLAALEQRIDADLAAGRHAALVGELEALVSEHPLRERLWAQLMLALYRSSRQAEALEAYRAARRSLSEELGLEPGTELKQLEQAILPHDPELDLAQPSAAPRRTPAPAAPERSVLVVPDALEDLPRLLRIAEPLAGAPPPRELVIAAVVAGAELGPATAALAARRDELHGRGVPARGRRVHVAGARRRHRPARRPGRGRPAAHGRRGGAARGDGAGGPRARAVRRGDARRGRRLARRRPGHRAVRRRLARLGGARARGVGRARDRQAAAADRRRRRPPRGRP